MGTDEDFLRAGHDFVIEILKSARKYLSSPTDELSGFLFRSGKADPPESAYREKSEKEKPIPDSPEDGLLHFIYHVFYKNRCLQ